MLSTRTGYLQTLERGDLLAFSKQNDVFLIAKKLPGDFILTGDVLIEVRTRSPAAIGTTQTRKLLRCFTFGDQRTEVQDPRYGARQLSEIASRALSPGINDPYTAMGCIDWAAESLAHVVRRFPAPEFYADAHGKLRLRLEGLATFDAMCVAMLNPIISYGLDSAVVARHLVEALQRVADRIDSPAQAHALVSYVHRVSQLTTKLIEDESEKANLAKATEILVNQLDEMATNAAVPSAFARE